MIRVIRVLQLTIRIDLIKKKNRTTWDMINTPRLRGTKPI